MPFTSGVVKPAVTKPMSTWNVTLTTGGRQVALDVLVKKRPPDGAGPFAKITAPEGSVISNVISLS